MIFKKKYLVMDKYTIKGKIELYQKKIFGFIYI